MSAGSLKACNKFMQQAFNSVLNVMQIRERNIKTRCAFELFMMLRDPFVELLNRVWVVHSWNESGERERKAGNPISRPQSIIVTFSLLQEIIIKLDWKIVYQSVKRDVTRWGKTWNGIKWLINCWMTIADDVTLQHRESRVHLKCNVLMTKVYF